MEESGKPSTLHQLGKYGLPHEELESLENDLAFNLPLLNNNNCSIMSSSNAPQSQMIQSQLFLTLPSLSQMIKLNGVDDHVDDYVSRPDKLYKENHHHRGSGRGAAAASNNNAGAVLPPQKTGSSWCH